MNNLNLSLAEVKRLLPPTNSEKLSQLMNINIVYPKVTAIRMSILFFIFGIICLILGGHIHYTNRNLDEIVIDYTECLSQESAQKCSDVINNHFNCQCRIPFKIEDKLTSRVFVYYQLEPFYQNHFLYKQSVDKEQLLGLTVTKHSLITNCLAFSYRNVGSQNLPIAPCGQIANTMFNDTIYIINRDLNVTVPWLKTGIAWEWEKTYNLHNPEPRDNLTIAFAKFAKPFNWLKSAAELDTQNQDNNGYRNEDFIVWMKVSGMHKFRKIYARINHQITNFTDGLPRGNYQLLIDYRFPVKSFGGTKAVVIANTSIYGTINNLFQAMFYFSGVVALVSSFFFLILHQRIVVPMMQEVASSIS